MRPVRLVLLVAALILAVSGAARAVTLTTDPPAGELVAGPAGRWTQDLTLASPDDVAPDTGAVVTPGGFVLPLIERTATTFVVTTPCGNRAEVARAAPVPRGSVVIDPGHGGLEPGAIGPNGLTEADLNLQVAGYVAAALDEAGVAVVMSRTGDYSMSIATRVALAEALGSALVVSVHHNAGARTISDQPGTEVYHQLGSEQSRRLGGLIYEEVRAALAQHGSDWRTFGVGVTWRTNAEGDDYFGMVRGPTAPAVLAELAFLDHPSEAELLARPEIQRQSGEAVAGAILRYLRTDEQGSGFVEGRAMGPVSGGPGSCEDPTEL